jgi:tyrosyl-tRNA synthetase
MLLQAYDFLYLFQKYHCKLQIGGADQWSNIISGIDLIKRKTGQQTFGFSMPLLTNSSGIKMGKTESGAIWLNEEYTNPFDFWQYWRNVDDNDVSKLLNLFTDISPQEADSVSKLVGTSKINDWKITLANEVTPIVHPQANLTQIKLGAKGDLEEGNYPTLEIKNPINLDDALVLAKLAESKSSAKKLIAGNGVKIDGNPINEHKHTVSKEAVLSVGKKKFVRIVIKNDV